MKKFIFFLILVVFFLGIAISVACRLYNLERKLDPINAEFLSKARYIITREERKIFLELPVTEKPKFIEEFWKRRDPDPETEENEFKAEYLGRIERAIQLFQGEGIPGWLTDRGRIYVIYGPPTDRITHPMGEDPYSRCSEVWYYADFPVVFYDYTCSSNYRLMTYDLSPIEHLNIANMPALDAAHPGAQRMLKEERRFFDFKVSVKKAGEETGKIEGTVIIEVPYDRIWFKSEEGKLATTLDVELELKDGQNKVVWQCKDSSEIKLNEAELEEKTGKSHLIEIPFSFDQESQLTTLRAGKNMLSVNLKNKTGNESLKKSVEFK